MLIIGVFHLRVHESPEKCTSNTNRRLGQSSVMMKSTHLPSSEEACSLNSLPLPLQVAEVEQYLEQYSLDMTRQDLFQDI